MEKEYPKRKMPRLKRFDYGSPGYYFITICTHRRQLLFGSISPSGQMIYSPAGRIAAAQLDTLGARYSGVAVDKSVVMPNHIHVILRLAERRNPFPTVDIPGIVGRYKAGVTRTVGRTCMPSVPLWQKSYHDHVIRTQSDYLRVWQYVDTNPAKWAEDCYYEGAIL